jgi:homoserine O-acetyltransferase/O-succinyltransferase
MNNPMHLQRILFLALALAGVCATARAAEPNAAEVAVVKALKPTSGDFTIDDYHFHAGGTLPKLKIHYQTLGTPRRGPDGHIANAVLILHGTGGSGNQFMGPNFAGELFGPGQPLDASKYFIVLPDNIGHGESSKPSDGLRAGFPHYDYDDMIATQHAVLTEKLGVDHLRLVMGTSMGCMHSFMWGEAYPGFADALMPLACLPIEIAGRNRVWRRMLVDGIRDDPSWNNGNYDKQPRVGLKTAVDMLLLAGSAPQIMQTEYPTAKAADDYLQTRTEKMLATLDANDLMYQVDSSRSYDPSARLGTIGVPVMWVNSTDDFINPPFLGVAEDAVKKLPHGRFVLIPASAATRGHGTHTMAVVWKQYLETLLEQSAHR